MKRKTGGLTKKVKKNKKANKTRIVYVQAPVDKAQEQAPVVIQNGTGLLQAAKTGVGTGAGLAIGSAIGNAVVGMFSSSSEE